MKKLLHLSCFVCCSFQLTRIAQQYAVGVTTTSLEFLPAKAMRLPVVTVCSTRPYRRRGAMFNEKDFADAVFAPEDLFSNV